MVQIGSNSYSSQVSRANTGNTGNVGSENSTGSGGNAGTTEKNSVTGTFKGGNSVDSANSVQQEEDRKHCQYLYNEWINSKALDDMHKGLIRMNEQSIEALSDCVIEKWEQDLMNDTRNAISKAREEERKLWQNYDDACKEYYASYGENWDGSPVY